MNAIQQPQPTSRGPRAKGTTAYLGKRRVRIQRVVLHHPPAYRVYMHGPTTATLPASFVVDGHLLTDRPRRLPAILAGPEQNHDG